MTIEIGVLFAILVAMAYLFFTEKISVELTAFAGLVVMVLGGFVPVGEAFTGFASPAVITMLSIFFLSAALLHTGLADLVGSRVHRMLGRRLDLLVVTIMLVAGILSAFMNNIAAVAVLMPAVASICQRTRVPPSRLFMPLSFGAILGGTTTLVGTPPNILAGIMLDEAGLAPFGLFDFTPVGGVLLVGGIVYMVLFGKRLLPDRGGAMDVSERGDLVQIYQLHESMFSIRVPRGSKLDGSTLRDAGLGRTLGVQITGVVRAGKSLLAPDADTVLRADDILLAKGKVDEVRELFRVRGAQLDPARPEMLADASETVTGVVARLRSESGLCGQSLRDARFRQRFGAIVIAIRRAGSLIEEGLGREPLRAGDELVAIGTESQLDESALGTDFDVAPLAGSVFEELEGHVFVLRVPAESDLVGTTIGESRMGELVGLTISGILRGNRTLLGLEPTEAICAEDRLLVTGEPSRIRSLLHLGDVHLQQDVTDLSIQSDGVGIVEATPAPRSRVAGKTVRELAFRERHGLSVLALWREGELLHADVANVELRFGDALLLQGPWNKIRHLASGQDFVVLSPMAQEPRRTSKAPLALAGLVLMIGFVASGYQPIHVAAFSAATFVALTRVITMEEAYRAVEWRAVFLVAAILPVGVAMQRTGAADLMSRTVVDLAGPAGPHAVLAGLVLLASVLSQCLDGAPAVVLLTPVALTTAQSLGIDPRPVMMGISLAASAAFMTPFSHKANLLVMGAGGYRTADYLRAGTPLTIVFLVLIVWMVPIVFPF